MVETEIMLVHAGCGKTFAAASRSDALDFTIGSYKYLNPMEGLSLRESEEIKASNGELSPAWPWNYIRALYDLKCSGEYRYIFAPVILELAQALEWGFEPCGITEPVPYTLVIPDISLKDEYERRYLKRGNQEAFIDIFISRGGWENWQGLFSRLEPTRRIVLQRGQFLSDILKCS